MKKYRLIKTLFLAIFLFSINFSISNAASSGIDVNLKVGECNNNGICEEGRGEDFFSCPADCTPIVVPPTPDGHGGTTTGSLVMDNVFNNLTVEVSYNSAIIKWKSVIPTMSSMKWGTNPDYKDGVLRNINFLLDHKVELTNLKEGTLYYFSIQAENLLGETTSLENQIFRTLSLLDTTPPSNPTNVKASSGPSGITISWDNPTEEDFYYIRVMRNDIRYYGSPFIGRLVYEGDGRYFTDSNVIKNNKYFYSLFSRDRAGNYSSGSLVSIIHNPLGLDNWGSDLTPVETVNPLPNVFTVTQNSSAYDFYPGSVFHLSGDEPINIKTNYYSKIKNDDMWVEIRNSDGIIINQYFFSRIKDKDGFINVTIPIFERGGYYRVAVYKYNSGAAQMVNYGSFDITKATSVGETVWSFWCVFWLIIIILLILLFLFFLFFKILPKIFKRFHKK